MRRNKFAFEEANTNNDDQIKTSQDLDTSIASIDQDHQELENNSEVIDGAHSDVQELQGYSNIMEKNLDNGMSPDAVEAIQLATESICKRLGIVKKYPKISLEAFNDLKNNKESTRLALEENGGVISRTLKAIIEAIKRAIAKIKEFIKKLFNTNQNLEKDTKENQETEKQKSGKMNEESPEVNPSVSPEEKTTVSKKSGDSIKDDDLCAKILKDIYGISAKPDFTGIKKHALGLLENTGYLYSATEKMIKTYCDIIDLLDDVKFDGNLIDDSYYSKFSSIFKTIRPIKDKNSSFELNLFTFSLGKEIHYDDRLDLDVSAVCRNLCATLRSFRKDENAEHHLMLPVLHKDDIREVNDAILRIIKNNEKLIISADKLTEKFNLMLKKIQALGEKSDVRHTEIMFRADCSRAMDPFVTRTLPSILSAHFKPIRGFNKWIDESFEYYS